MNSRNKALAFFGFFLAATAAWSQQYVITTFAGGAPPPTPGAALTIPIGQPHDVATDSAGNVYFTSSNCVFKLDSTGTVTRIAGTGKPGFGGDGGTADRATFNGPRGIAIDSAGNLFIADSGNNRIRRIFVDGTITTVAGNGVAGFSGDSGPAVSAQLYAPVGIAVDAAGNVFIADSVNNRIRTFSSRGIMSTVAGTGVAGFTGDGGPATAARLTYPLGVAVDGLGDIFIADTNNTRIRKISSGGTISTVATGGGYHGSTGGPNGSGCPVSPFFVQACGPTGVASDVAGNVFFADTFNNRVIEIATNGALSEFAGNLLNPWAVAVDRSGNLYIANASNYLNRVSAAGLVTVAAGNGVSGFSGDGGLATNAQLSLPSSIAVDGSGNLVISDGDHLRKVSTDGTISSIEQQGVFGGGSVAFDKSGNLYVVGSGSIYKVSTNGDVTPVAGTAQISVTAIAVDGLGNLFIADHNHFRVWKVATGGAVTTVAGTGTPGFSGDGGPAINATMYGPFSIAADASGNLFIGDNYRVRKVTTDGIINTIAGSGGQTFTGDIGDGGPAINAPLFPNALAVDGQGNLFIAVEGNFSVRKVSTSGIITTVAGNGVYGYAGDGGSGAYSQLSLPVALAADAAGNVYVADQNNAAVRKLTPTIQPVLITALVDAASGLRTPVSPGKIVAIYGSGLGPATGVIASPSNGGFGTGLAGTTVSFNGVAAPIYYASATQVNVIVPYSISGPSAFVTVSWQGNVSLAAPVPVAPASPGIFTYNASGAGQAAAINVADGTLNTAANPARVGDFISIYATGEGQTSPAGVDGKVWPVALLPLPPPTPLAKVTADVGGVAATVQYAGGVPLSVAGLLQVNIQIPKGVAPGGYVPVVLTVGSLSTADAVWIAVSN